MNERTPDHDYQREYKRSYMQRKRQDPAFVAREKWLHDHSNVRMRNADRNGRCYFCERPATTTCKRMTLGADDWEETEVPYCGRC
jgi:hypothetical protein